jgi:hypothetical protein
MTGERENSGTIAPIPLESELSEGGITGRSIDLDLTSNHFVEAIRCEDRSAESVQNALDINLGRRAAIH